MGSKRFTEQEIADLLEQVKNGASNKFLCEKYDISTSTLRRWKERHDEVIRNELKKMESTSLAVFFCLITVSVALAIVFSKAAGAICILLILGYCVFYIVRFRNESSKFVIKEYVFLSRTGLGASNVFYTFSWLFVIFVAFIVAYGFVA